jgi:hypothetical protein
VTEPNFNNNNNNNNNYPFFNYTFADASPILQGDINITLDEEQEEDGKPAAIPMELTPTATRTTVPTAEMFEPTTPAIAQQIQTTTSQRRNLVASLHGFDWHHEPQLCLQDINGTFFYQEWGLRCAVTNSVLRRGCNLEGHYSRLDIFLYMFPPQQLTLMLEATNKQLTSNPEMRCNPTTIGELLKFLGIVILTTKFKFTSRASLWSTTPATKYELALDFGRFGMSRKQFDEIWKNIRFSYQPATRPDDMSSEKYRWLLVDDFVKNFNQHRKDTFIPSDLLCVDESISRWYGQGGEWINHGLPMYVAINRKPENGCEIQDCACGRSGVMLQLKLVKTAKEQATTAIPEDNNLLHGTKVLKELISPWSYTDRLVCADSYFASVGAAEELRNLKFRFICVIKTATKRYPMEYLKARRLHARGDREGLVHKDPETGIPDMLAFVWLDRERRFFVASASSLTEGDPYSRRRWRQVDKTPNAKPEKTELEIPVPKAAEIYYSCCAKVDQHNRDRQDTLGIENTLRMHEWSLRVNLSIFSIIAVDAWKVYSQISYSEEVDNKIEVQKDFYGHLVAEMIDNNYDQVGGNWAK